MFLFFLLFLSLKTTISTLTILDSCNDLPDGIYNLKFLESDEYPVVSVKCSNGYAILDYKQDNDIKDYFVSWTQWHHYTVGPSNEEDSKSLKWNEWFIPGQYDSKMKFIISPDCNTCEEDNMRQLYGTETTYWMSGTLFGCFWEMKNQHSCDVDWETDQCYSCANEIIISNQVSTRVAINDESNEADFSATGICPHIVQSATINTPKTHDLCSHKLEEEDNMLHLKPSLGIAGKYCVCVQSSSQKKFDINEELVTAKQLSSNKIEIEIEIDDTSSLKTYHLYHSDFEAGTYRIKKPGVYIIMEDISFNFNPNYDTPNSNNAWMPTSDQADMYPGADDYHDHYFMGFFAGISIECNDVTLNLNGYTIQMSEHFYYQQRWFTAIELSTQYFFPGQGIGNFGGNPSISSNVIIKNGIIGLSSHHGIHGNYNQNILIENVKIQNFETHGIQINGFANVVIRNVEVGPTSSKVYFTGEYGHARFLLPRYQLIAEETKDQKIQFYGRKIPITMAEIVEKLETELDMAWNYVVNNVELTKHDEDYDLFVEAKRLFINENGILNAGAQYGIFLNTYGASVYTYNLYTGYWSTKAILENVKIHDMQHSMKEYVRMHLYGTNNVIINPFNGPLNVEELINDVNSLQPFYVGNVLLDAIMASNKLSDNWGYLQMQSFNDYLVPWATGEDVTSLMHESIQIGCNVDAMVHSGKGIHGLRLDGIKDVLITNLEIYNLKDSTPIGKDVCGNYDGFDYSAAKAGGHFFQTAPMQVGFSGNMNQAVIINSAENVIIKDVKINNIESETGPAFGISIWPSCSVELQGDITVSNILAGSKLERDTFTYNDRPNKAPEACGVRVYYEYQNYATTVKYEKANIQSSCITGHVGCLGEKEMYTMLGMNENNDECEIHNIPQISQNINISSMLSNNSKSKFAQFTLLSSVVLLFVYGFYHYYFSLKTKYYNNNVEINYHLISNGTNYGSI